LFDRFGTPKLTNPPQPARQITKKLTAVKHPMDYKHLEFKDRDNVVVANLKVGTILDQSLIERIGAELQAAALEAAATRKLVLNFQQVQFMSSAMLGKLVLLQKKCKNDKIVLKMCNISANVMEVFTITKLNKLFDIVKDESTAVGAFGIK
jgi:anti-sigma B factor antagonist